MFITNPTELRRVALNPETTLAELSEIHEYIKKESYTRYVSDGLLPVACALLQNPNISVAIIKDYLLAGIDTNSLLRNPSLSLLVLEDSQYLRYLNSQETGRWFSDPELPIYLFPLLDTTHHWSGIEQYHVSLFTESSNAPIETWFPLLRDFLRSIPMGYAAPLCHLKDTMPCSIAWLLKHFPASFVPDPLPLNIPVAELEKPYYVHDLEELLTLAYHPELPLAVSSTQGAQWMGPIKLNNLRHDFYVVLHNISLGDARRYFLLLQPDNSFGTFARVCAGIVPNASETYFGGSLGIRLGANYEEANWLVRLGTVACPETTPELLPSYLNDGIFFVRAMAQFRLNNPRHWQEILEAFPAAETTA
jgi:hypothetical protein